MAIACFLLVTTPPLPPFPERRVPFCSRRTALSTLLAAALPYFAILFCLLTVLVNMSLAFVLGCANRVLPVAVQENVPSVCSEGRLSRDLRGLPAQLRQVTTAITVFYRFCSLGLEHKLAKWRRSDRCCPDSRITVLNASYYESS